MSNNITIAALILLTTLCWSQDDSKAMPSTEHPQVIRRIRVSAAVMRGLIRRGPLPSCPSEAIRSGVKGDVIFEILIDESGNIVTAVPVEGDPLLSAASTESLYNFRFTPYFLNGIPVQVESQLGFHFLLKGRGEKAICRVEYMETVPFREEFRTGSMSDQAVLILWPPKISGPEPRLPQELTGKSGLSISP